MNNAEAGPSTVIDPALYKEPIIAPTDTVAAPLKPLPSTHFYSVEFPGYVQASSVTLAMEHLGGQSNVYAAFKRTGNKSGSLLELNMRPGNPFSHPIPGDIVSTNNILLKIIKRKRRVRSASNTQKCTGEYIVQTMGSIPKTTRFRST